jgi:hypothetical protein
MGLHLYPRLADNEPRGKRTVRLTKRLCIAKRREVASIKIPSHELKAEVSFDAVAVAANDMVEADNCYPVCFMLLPSLTFRLPKVTGL